MPLSKIDSDSLSAPLTVPAGSAAAPAITTTGDTNTGIFFPAADTIAFAEGGAEAMRINSSGNVLFGSTVNIGSTVSTGATLAVSTVSPVFKLTKTFKASFTTNPQTRNVSITITDSIGVAVEITICGTYANADYAGAMKRAYGFLTNTAGTTLYGSANASMYSVGSGGLVAAYAFGAATKPNNTTVNLPINYTGADTDTTLFVVVEIFGDAANISGISFS